MPCKYIEREGIYEIEKDTTIRVAFKQKDWDTMSPLYMFGDLQEYSLERRFYEELKLALLRL